MLAVPADGTDDSRDRGAAPLRATTDFDDVLGARWALGRDPLDLGSADSGERESFEILVANPG